MVYLAHILSGESFWTTYYLTQRSVLPLNNPQNSEMKICENIKLKMLKIIQIIIGYALNDFTTHITTLYIYIYIQI